MKLHLRAIKEVFRKVLDRKTEIDLLNLEIRKLNTAKLKDIEINFFNKYNEGAFEFKRISRIEGIVHQVSNSDGSYKMMIEVGQKYYDMDGNVILDEILYSFATSVIGSKERWTGWTLLVRKNAQNIKTDNIN